MRGRDEGRGRDSITLLQLYTYSLFILHIIGNFDVQHYNIKYMWGIRKEDIIYYNLQVKL